MVNSPAARALMALPRSLALVLVISCATQHHQADSGFVFFPLEAIEFFFCLQGLQEFLDGAARFLRPVGRPLEVALGHVQPLAKGGVYSAFCRTAVDSWFAAVSYVIALVSDWVGCVLTCWAATSVSFPRCSELPLGCLPALRARHSGVCPDVRRAVHTLHRDCDSRELNDFQSSAASPP